MRHLFGTDGIRGIANVDLTSDFAMKLGIATALTLTKNKKKQTIIIGKDTRLSGDMLTTSLIAGLTSIGVNIINLGVIPTPAVSYLVQKYKAIAGIMVSASHNPYEYNGIKIFDRNGYKLPDELEIEIEEALENLTQNNTIKYSNTPGTILEGYTPYEDYIHHLTSTITNDLKDLHIAVDCANGSASVTAPLLFEKLSCHTTFLNNHPNGTNINKECGSTYIENLTTYVINHNLDCGIAYDGDADRCIMVDNKGQIIDGDYLLAIATNDLKTTNKLKNNTLVGTVMSNLGLIKFCQQNNINFISTKVGDRYVLEEMLLKNYIIGGEQSGHIIYKEYANTGDGELTSLKILEIMSKTKKSLHDLSSIMQKYPQVLINVPVDNNHKNDFYKDELITKEIENLNQNLQDDGRILVRPSGTEPLIRVMIEGKDEQLITKYATDLANLIKKRLS